jgi:hypothetical protein
MEPVDMDMEWIGLRMCGPSSNTKTQIIVDMQSTTSILKRNGRRKQHAKSKKREVYFYLLKFVLLCAHKLSHILLSI